MATAKPAFTILNAPPDFDAALEKHGLGALIRDRVTTLQVNVGKLCNQACLHCHVEAGPKRTEIMPLNIVERVLELLALDSEIEVVDITGGAPELNPHFRHLAAEIRRMGRRVIDRCNLTVFFEAGQETLLDFLTGQKVEVIASLPCYTEENVDQQRGRGVFQKSIDALRMLNARGYGKPGTGLDLSLVYNPLGPSLPPPQGKLEADYKIHLREEFGIEFNRLFTITNMPIKRFSEFLRRTGKEEEYMDLLAHNFSAATVPHVMCRLVVSIGWNGLIYDCDFNQMLEMESGAARQTGARTIWDIQSFADLNGQSIATASHCFGCTAGAGSSCGGALQ